MDKNNRKDGCVVAPNPEPLFSPRVTVFLMEINISNLIYIKIYVIIIIEKKTRKD